MSTVAIAGSGLAELTCAWLLVGRGHRIRLAAPASAPGAGARPLLLTEPTLELIDCLWGGGLLDDAWSLTHRQVRWGAGARTTRFAQSARVVDGAGLAARIRERLGSRPLDAGGPARWTVTARAPDGPLVQQTLGRRQLLAGTASLRAGRCERTATLDTTGLGWLQLTPLGSGDCLVQAMVPGPAEDPAWLLAQLLAESEAGGVLSRPPRTAAAIPAAPRLHLSPALPPTDASPSGLLTVGSGAIRYDPLSGTGTAQALRTAILAAAVIDADADGTPAAALCWHYTVRLRAAFAEHRGSCAELYGSTFTSGAWQDELDAARLSPALRASQLMVSAAGQEGL